MTRADKGNFDLIRLVAAATVLFSHAFLVTQPVTAQGASTGRDPLEMIDGGLFSLGSLAVGVFFVLSGYLVAQSWLGDRRPFPYLARRVLRIGPGLVATVLVTVLVVGPIASSATLGQYLSAPATRSYLGDALLYHEQLTLPGVFQNNVWQSDVNGSLWTLRYEFTWYVAIPLIALAGIGMARRLAPVLLVITLATLATLPRGASHPLPAELDFVLLLVLGSFALAGMTLYVYRDVVPKSGRIATGLMLLWVVTWHTPLLNVTAALAFGYMAIYLATLPAAGRGRLVPKADISYGVYLYGFVAEQIAVAALGARANAATVLAVAVPLTAGCAMLSWKFVERPALRLKAHLRPRLEGAQQGGLSTEAVGMLGAVAPEGISSPVDAAAR